MFDTLFYRPILNTLIFLYDTVAIKDLGLAIILITILVRVVLYPFYHKMTEHQAIMNRIKPELDRINKEHKGDKTKQGLLLAELYKENKVNPFFPFIFLIIQIPIVIALYKAINVGINGDVGALLYKFVAHPGEIKFLSFGLIDLKAQNIAIVLLTTAAQFYQSKLAAPMTQPVKDGEPSIMPTGNTLAMMMSGITLVVLWKLSAAIGIYWLTSTLFSVGQQLISNRQIRNAELKRNN